MNYVNPMAESARAAKWRKAILVCWIAAMPVTKTFTFGGTRVNLAASDVLTPFGLGFLAWLAFRRELKFPALLPCILMLLAVDASLLVNIGASLQIKDPTGIVVEMLKILMLWLQFYVVVNAIRAPSDFRLALRAWLYTGAVISLIGIAGALAWQMTGIENEYSLMFRAQGTLADSNLFAAYLALSLLLAVLLWQIDRTSRKAVAIVGAILIAGIFFSASRGTMLSLTATVLLLAGLAMQWKTRMIGAVSLLLAAMAVMAMPGRDELLAANPYTERLATATVNVNDDAASDRKELWLNAIEHVEASPIFGMGRGTFHLEIGPERSQITKVHDTFLGIACETGLLGVVAFALTFFGDAVRLARQRFATGRPFPASTRTLLGAMLIVMLCGVTISIENFRGLWILVGFLEAYRRLFGAYGPREARVA
jgi:O-antigen ligase